MHLEHVDVLVITIIKYIPIISVYGMCHLFNYIYPCLCRAIYSSLIHRLHMHNVCALTYVYHVFYMSHVTDIMLYQ